MEMLDEDIDEPKILPEGSAMVHLYHEGVHPTPTIRPLPVWLVEPTDAHA